MNKQEKILFGTAITITIFGIVLLAWLWYGVGSKYNKIKDGVEHNDVAGELSTYDINVSDVDIDSDKIRDILFEGTGELGVIEVGNFIDGSERKVATFSIPTDYTISAKYCENENHNRIAFEGLTGIEYAGDVINGNMLGDTHLPAYITLSYLTPDKTLGRYDKRLTLEIVTEPGIKVEDNKFNINGIEGTYSYLDISGNTGVSGMDRRINIRFTLDGIEDVEISMSYSYNNENNASLEDIIYSMCSLINKA